MAYPNIHAGFTDKTEDRSHHIKTPLHQFASYNSIFTLSGVKEEELNNRSFLTNPVHDIIARSGGIGEGNTQASDGLQIGGDAPPKIKADPSKFFDYESEAAGVDAVGFEASKNILNRNHDIFIEDVNILSTVGPNTQRNMASVTKMDFRIHEPYSITFIEKVRAATLLNGFLDYQDAPLLLTIDFVGTDENGQQVKAYGLTRKIPILIVRVEFEVNEGGAVYDVIAVPLNEMAFDDRYKMARTDINIEPSNPEDFAAELNDVIKTDQAKEIKDGLRQFEDTYKFTVHPELVKQIRSFSALPGVHTQGSVSTWLKKGKSVSGTAGTSNPRVNRDIRRNRARNQGGTNTGSGIETEIPRGSSLPEAFSDYIRTLPPYRDFATDFWKAYYTMTATITNFAIDDGTGILYTKNRRENNKKIAKLQADPKKQDELYKTYQENQYIPWYRIKSSVRTNYNKFDRLTQMHPKEIHYEAVPYKVHILKLLKPGVSIGKVNWDDFVRKSYNYIYTGDNVDINALRINYKSAYYMRAVRPEVKTGTESGELNPFTKAFNFLFPNETQPEKLLPIRQYPSVIKGRSATEGIPSVAQEFFDYLTNPVADMMNIQIDILGDPGYLTQDNFVPIVSRTSENDPLDEVSLTGFEEEWNTSFNSFNSDRYQPIINLKYRLPADVNERKGFMFSRESKSIDENLFFSGAYQVYKVDSRFERGAFTQTLHCVRLNNQQGTGVPAVLFTAANKSTEIKTDNPQNKGLDGVLDYGEEAQNIPSAGQKIIDFFKGKKGNVSDQTLKRINKRGGSRY